MNPGEPLAEGHLLDGRYRVKKVLGVGGMGRVYLANDTRLANRPVAAKEMVVGEGIAEKKAIEDFTREATVLARLSHTGIPTLIDHFAERGRHYLVMEFVAGGDLEQVLEEVGPGGKVPEEKVVRWARQILEVLDFLHAQTPPIIYRDLKPGNIMIDKEGRAMLIDFGIARFLPKGGHATQIGSPGYAPPEQYTGKVEPRSDLYALAATMHHLLTGRDPRLEPPFSFPPVRQLAPEVSATTAAVVDRALSHAPDRRFATAREMLHALPEAAEESGNGAAARSRTGAKSGDSLGSMSTVVLQSQVSTPASSRPPRSSGTPAKSSSPTPRRLTPPRRISGARPSELSQMRTVVLDKPAPAHAAPAAAPRKVAPPIRKALELTEKARALIERGLKSKLVEAILPPLQSDASVSSTAKTQDLKRPGGTPSAAGAPAARIVTGNSSPARTGQRASSQGSTAAESRTPADRARQTPALFPNHDEDEIPAGEAARLIARAENVEFALKRARVVIGRSQDPADALDVDLAPLKRGAERVSRKHAEILRRGGDYFIRDLGSLNGTYIAGRGRLGRDQLYKLKDRDQVVLGGAILQFRRG
jgi:serine/threonine protein kinase